MDGTITYLNTDLDLVSTDDLRPLAASLAARGLFTLHVERREDGRWYASFETDEQLSEPEPTIAAMLMAVESLTELHRAMWWACTRREFNIGFDCSTTPRAFTQTLSSSLLRRIVALDASLGVTLYAERDRDTPTERA